MSEQMTLNQYRYRGADVCAGRHHGNANSASANMRAEPHKHGDRQRIYELIRDSEDGMTLKELCSAMKRLPNEVSGRLTELKTGRFKNGSVMIRVSGSRNGCGVHYAIK